MKYATHRPVPPSRVKHAKAMRLAMTGPERKLWKAMRWHMPTANTHFRRPVPIGPYIVDFCCLAAKLIVEADGNQHGTDESRRRDAARPQALENQGFHVLRFANEDINGSIDAVLETVLVHLPSPQTSAPAAGEEISSHG